MSNSASKPTKNEKREAARQHLREQRKAEGRKRKRNRLLIQAGVLVGVIGLLAGIWGIWSASHVPPGPGPANMISGGVIFDSQTDVAPTESQPAESETRAEPKFDDAKTSVTVYADYMCPGCGNFEQTYGNLLTALLDSGDIQLHVVPVALLDPQSAGTKYSSRAANLIGCLVTEQPEVAYATHGALFELGTQPAEGTAGLTDKQLLSVAKQAGAEMTGELQSCVLKRVYAPFFQQSRDTFSVDGVVGLGAGERLLMPGNTGELQPEGEVQRLVGTPTVIVDGVQWKHEEDFALFLEKFVSAKSGGEAE